MLKTYIHRIYPRAISYLQKTLLKHRGYYKIEKENLEDFKMVKPLSGAILAEKMANGTLTNEEQNAINAQRKKSKEAVSLFTKQKEKNLQQGKEFARGYAIEAEKERRVKAGLPEYDIQQSEPSKPLSKSEYRKQQAIKNREKQQAKAENSEWKAKVHQESAAKAKVAKAEHNATTNPNANEKKVHKELKNAERMSPGSTANVNEKELIETIEKNKAKATAPTVAPSGTGAVTGEAGAATKTVANGTKVATEEASHVAQTAVKSGSKFTKFLKKGGKIGAALLVIGGLFYGIKKLFGGGDDDKKTQANTPVQEQKDTPAPADKTKKPAKGSDGETTPAPVGSDSPTQPAKGEEKADDKAKPADKKEPAKVVPAPVADDKNKEDKVDKKDNAEKADKSEEAKKRNDRTLPQNYTVKKGDNVWNIAKRRLQEMNGKKPTDKEIMNYTNELLKLNKLEYEPDGYTVIIHKGDNIEYAA